VSTIVIAPDSFKGSAEAHLAATAIANGWASERPDDRIVLLPMADGGEGTVEAFATAFTGASRRFVSVTGPDDRPVEAEWVLLPDGTGVVELANASGITLLDPLRPLDAHSIGFGEVIAAALDAGAERLLLGIGGSASTDGGAGALTALGAQLLDASGSQITPGGGGLAALATVDLSELRALPADGAIVLSDVTNPLLGPTGAAAVFGPQKGATGDQLGQLDANLAQFARVLGGDPDAPGAGAAGGVGFGLTRWGATLVAGSAAVGAALGIPDAIASADLVITGEGRFDDQSAAGKVPSYLSSIAAAAPTPIALVAGLIEAPTDDFTAAVSLTELAGSSDRARTDALRWLTEAGALLARRW
jgi:glycerate 2-kinase